MNGKIDKAEKYSTQVKCYQMENLPKIQRVLRVSPFVSAYAPHLVASERVPSLPLPQLYDLLERYSLFTFL